MLANMALLHAAERGDTNDIQRLLNEGASPTVRDLYSAYTPIIIAKMYGHTNAVALLVTAAAAK